jgi:GNAT superfamily N-acetyltransferase
MPLSPLVPAEPAVLRDGAAVDVRATGPDDLEVLTRFHESLSDESRLMRFLFLGVDIRRVVERLLAPGVTGLAAVAGSEVIGHGCLVPAGPSTAELAFAVADDWQQRGVATVLLERLVAEADARGLTTLTAEVHPANRRMSSRTPGCRSASARAPTRCTSRCRPGSGRRSWPASRSAIAARPLPASTTSCAPRRSR